MLERVIYRLPSLVLKVSSRRSVIPICRASSTPVITNQGAIQKKKDDDMLETIDIEDLPRAQKRFAKQFEKVNEERVKEIFAKNYKNHIAFGVLICLVVGIYFYTMTAVKQETFLEEIDVEMAAEKPATHGHLLPNVEKK